MMGKVLASISLLLSIDKQSRYVEAVTVTATFFDCDKENRPTG